MDLATCVMKNVRVGLLFVYLFFNGIQIQAINEDCKDLIHLAKRQQMENPDSAIYLYNEAKLCFLNQGDTITAIRALNEMSLIYSTQADYSKSYDGFWDALILSYHINDSTLVGETYNGLAMLYSLFERYDQAEKYFKESLRVKKQFLAQNPNANNTLNNTYYSMTINYRELGKYRLAQAYLDSCKQVVREEGKKEWNNIYVKAEQAYLYYHQGRYNEAIALLNEIEPAFKESNTSYLVILYSFLGDIYLKEQDWELSRNYYLKSLEIAKKYKSHKNYVPDVYEKLAKLYLKTNKLRSAYDALDMSKSLNDSIFGARSVNNNSLLQIKDDYRQEQEKIIQLEEQARINKLEQEKRIWFLRNIILLVSLAFLLLVFLIIFYWQKNKHKQKHRLLIERQRLDTLKNKEILEIKNKELTSSALQLIEKDELLLEIKDKLRRVKDKEASEALNKIKANSKHDWKEFDARFTSVNQGFYKSLSEQFPELTQRDHKLCALIKLNFSSKEMASLLGISIESVHTSRYRLRQKLKLGKGVNLTEFIAKIE